MTLDQAVNPIGGTFLSRLLGNLLMQTSVMVSISFTFWRDRNVPPIGLIFSWGHLPKLRFFSKICLEKHQGSDRCERRYKDGR